MKIKKMFFLTKKARRLVFLSFFLLPSSFFPLHARRYDAFTAEIIEGLDYVAVKAQNPAAAGELGREVYPEGVDGEYDVFIPTTNYVRLGIGANFGFAGTALDAAGEKMKYRYGITQQFGFGWNFASFIRGEIGWSHGDMRFAGADANLDAASMVLYFDLARRHVMRGDVTWRRKLIPFIGMGGIAGYAAFDDKGAEKGQRLWTGGARGALGISFAFTETNAIDFTAIYDHMWGDSFGWTGEEKEFGNFGAAISWRASF